MPSTADLYSSIVGKRPSIVESTTNGVEPRSDSPFFSEAGGVLVIEKGINDYSFSEISQIVESNDGKLLGAFISKTDNDISQITLKIGQIGLSGIIQTFRRYSYNIVSGHEEDSYIESLKERSQYLDKYLNM